MAIQASRFLSFVLLTIYFQFIRHMKLKYGRNNADADGSDFDSILKCFMKLCLFF